MSKVKPAIRWIWILFLSGLGIFTLVFFSLYFNWFGNMPSMLELENPSSAVSSEVYANDGTLLGRYFVQDRSTSKYAEISPNIINALVATEDARFYDHSGIDGKAVLRAIIFAGREGGGSTITQQLALNLFNGERARNKWVRATQKLKEWVLAVKLERNLTKNEIITLYLNTVPFSDNIYGIKNASLTFFQKQPSQVTVDEAAVLIGMLKGNTIYNPRRFPDRSLGRRNTVISLMAQHGKISDADAAQYKAKPLRLNYHKLDYHEGLAPYFRQVLEQELKKICKDLKKEDGSSYNIYRDGLKIYTTIDPKMQHYAEEALEEHMKTLQKQFFAQSGYGNLAVWKGHDDVVIKHMRFSDRYQSLKDQGMSEADIIAEFKKPVQMKIFAWNETNSKDTVMSPWDSIKYTRTFVQGGFMAMDPMTGEVKAWVGGINHDYYQYDHVNTNARRQVGSTIKPLLYCLALDNGFSPCGIVSTSTQVFNGKPYDAGGSKYGSMVMSRALALSVNNAALYLIKQVGIPSFIEFIHRCGISSKIDPVPSIALGVSDISLFEMLGAYTMFPGGGIHTEPYFITKIEDKNGVVLKTFTPLQKEIINAQTAYKMVKMMRGVIDHGTGRRLRYRYGLKADIAGKTGTTNKQTDAWFIGYTPQILAGAWVGADDPFLHFRSEAIGQGAAAALPIWGIFYKKVSEDKKLDFRDDVKFAEPADFDDCDSYDPNSLMRADYNTGGSHSQEDDNEIEVNKDYTPNSEWGPQTVE